MRGHTGCLRRSGAAYPYWLTPIVLSREYAIWGGIDASEDNNMKSTCVWNMLQSWISETCGFPLNFNKCEILFGKIGKKYEALNIITIIVKY